MKNIGDLVWIGYTKREEKRVSCPDCFGSGRLTVTLGDNSQVGIDCVACERGWRGSIGVLEGYEHVAACNQGSIMRVERNSDGEIEYAVGNSSSYHTGPIFETEEDAMKYAESLIAKRNAEEDRRMRSKERDAKSWAWNASYHRREIRECKKKIEYHERKLVKASVKAKEDKGRACGGEEGESK